MAVLSRNHWVSQQRIDIPDLLASESFTAFDFRTIISIISGLDKSYIVRGFEVVGKTGLTLEIKVADSIVLNPQDGNGSFYTGLSDDSNIIVSLPANQSNIFIEAVFETESSNPVSRGQWDPLALSGSEASGTEFTAATDFQVSMVLKVSVNTVGFSEGAIPLVRAQTSASAVIDMKDSRDLLFRLGSGGANPDPANKFDWANSRTEPVQNGTGVGDAVDSPWRSRNATGILNDKGINSLKEFINALLTKITEITGSSLWYAPSTTPWAPANNASLYQLFFDTVGSNIQPSPRNAFKWKSSGGSYTLAGEGSTPLVLGTYREGLITWKSNYSNLVWHLGATFIGSGLLFRNYTSVRFESPAVVDGGNIYLKLEREVVKGSGSAVSWKPASAPGGINAARAVVGVGGDFTGIALGDYIRKESEGYGNYFKVVKMWDGVSLYDNTNNSHQNKVADASIIALELQSLTDPGFDISVSSSEPLKYFRSRYSNSDIFADVSANVFNYQDANFYWLGRRAGDYFILRDYGTMQIGEEVTTLDSTYAQGSGGGLSSLILEHSYGSIYDVTGYKLKSGASTTLLTIRRYKRDNTSATPGPTDNSSSMLSYTINAPVGLLSVGDSLWVRLSETTSGVLSSGSVIDSSSDLDNQDNVTNRWEIRSEADTPLKSFDNKDVFWIAKREVINGYDSLIFADGSVLNNYGQMFNNHVEIVGDLKLTNKTNQSLLFIHKTINGQVDEDNTELFYDKPNKLLGLLNLRIDEDSINQDVPKSQTLFANMGAHTLFIGDVTSTTRILGDLIVQGNYVAQNVANIQSEDGLISLGVGNLVDSAQGNGIEVADDTRASNTIDSYNGQIYVDITYSTPHGYVLGNIISINASIDVGGITAGQIGGQYTAVAVGSSYGDIEVTGANTIRVFTNGTATSGTTVSSPTIKTFLAPWSIRLGDASGSYASTLTSWVFRAKGVTTAPTLTPFNGYGIVATSNSTTMLQSRIPFVNNDNSGPSGVDSTLNYSPNFTWDNSLSILSVSGTLSMTGNILPSVDNTYDLGETTTPLRWRAIHLGFGASSGITAGTDTNLYRSAANHWKTDDEFEVALTAFFNKETTYTNYASLTYPSAPSSGKLSLYTESDITWQRASDGDIRRLTNIDGNVYEEFLTVVTSPSVTPPLADNEIAPVLITSLPYIINIPKDSKKLLGNFLTATTVSPGSGLVNITKNNHGLTTGNFITIAAVSAIDGIAAVDLSVTAQAVTVIDPNTLQYTASANATLGGVSGTLALVTAEVQRYYTVGSSELEIFLNGDYLQKDLDWAEVGSLNSLSQSVSMLRPLVVGDVLTFRIDSNGGQYIVNQNGGTTLQAAYNALNTITIASGVPVTINGPSGEKLLSVNGDVYISGVIDPKGIVFTPENVTPLSVSDNGLWVDNTASKPLIYQRQSPLPAINLVEDFIRRDGTQGPSADQPWNGFKITGAAFSSAVGEYVTHGQVPTAINDTADFNAGNRKLTNLGTPTASGDAATKAYVDDPSRYAGVYVDLTNNTGSTVTAGSVVMISQAVANELIKADATLLSTGEATIGVASANISNGASGKIQLIGKIAVSGGPFVIGKPVYLSETSGQATSTPPTAHGTVVVVLGWAVSTTEVVINPYLDSVNDSSYEEVIAVVSGAPANDNEFTGPVLPGTTLTLPLDSRNLNSQKQYIVGSGHLEVFLNGLLLEIDDEWEEIGIIGSLSQTIQINKDLAIGDELTIRIDLKDTTYFSGPGGGATLQSAYNGGISIATTTGNPVTISGTAVVLDVNGDLNVTGLIL